MGNTNTDRAHALRVLSRGAGSVGRVFSVQSLTRTITVCADCEIEYDPADAPAPIDGCAQHGEAFTTVMRWSWPVLLQSDWRFSPAALSQLTRMVAA